MQRLRICHSHWLTIAKGQPTVLVLDELHWADQDSLRLLRYVARFVNRSRLVILGTYGSRTRGCSASQSSLRSSGESAAASAVGSGGAA